MFGMTSVANANVNAGTIFELTLPPANVTWSHAGSGSWNSPGNWDGNSVPGSNAQDTAIFGTVIGSTTATVTLDGSWTIASLTFSTTGGGSYVISRSAGDTHQHPDADRHGHELPAHQQRRQPNHRRAGRARQQPERQCRHRQQPDRFRAHQPGRRGHEP